jgi:hypothetical protein
VRKLILLMIAFIAIATFFSAYDQADAGEVPQQPGIEAGINVK